MKNIRNIIFDFGNVLINLDYQRTLDEFARLGVDNMQSQFAYGRQQLFFDDLEMGLVTNDAFYNYIRTLANKPLADADIAHAWNAMLLDFPGHRIEMLKTLREKGYRLFLLSNTNDIHKKRFYTDLQARYGFDIFTGLFEKSYFSSEIGMRKPNSNIYEHLLNTHTLEPTETIFIDDVEENLLPAKALGINTIHKSREKDVATILETMPVF